MEIENESIVAVWDKLNKTNNIINVLETELAVSKEIKVSNLKEILVQCSFGDSNDRIINMITSYDQESAELLKQYILRNTYEIYILNEIQRMKLTEPMICIAFLKEYKKQTWQEITNIMNYSEKQCRRYYNTYKDIKSRKKMVFMKDDQK